MRAYLDVVKKVLESGERKANRTGVDALTVAGAMFEHDMSEGFPLLTTKRVPERSVRVELEFFVRGLTDKRWLQERGCKFWDEWCSPDKVPYGHDEATRTAMREERDLGPVYGYQWRHFGARYSRDVWEADGGGVGRPHRALDGSAGVDQLARVVERLRTDPSDRRMIVSAWNPAQLGQMALPACHWAFQVTVVNGRLNLLWNMRSVDVMLGLPCNIASYGLLLHLLAKGAGLAEGRLVAFMADTHIYVNHVEGAREQLSRTPTALPRVVTGSVALEPFTNILDWRHHQTTFVDYAPQPSIKLPVAV